MTEPAGLLLRPDWDLPAGIQAFVTTRHGGARAPPWDTCNLALHVGDEPAQVTHNRRLLQTALARAATPAASTRALAGTALLPPALQWLQQEHGTAVFTATTPQPVPAPRADAAYTRVSGLALAVLTADCLPVLFCSDDGTEIAVAHAGWRGLCAGVLEASLACFEAPPAAISAWLGPALGPCHFEVGAEVRQAFVAAAPTAQATATANCFRPGAPGKWWGDLYQLATLRLQASGVLRIAGTGQCTWCGHERFYSYRRQRQTGRFASVIFRC